MSGWIEVTRRELHGRRILWGAALALGLLAPAAPLVFTNDSGPAAAALFAILLSAFLAFGVCGNMIGGELSERRLSFYFARPLSGGAIFAGKLLAAALLTYGAQLLVWLPTAILEHRFLAETLRFAGLLALGTPLLLALGLVAGVAARCRSRWLLADLAVAIALMALVAFLLSKGASGDVARLALGPRRAGARRWHRRGRRCGAVGRRCRRRRLRAHRPAARSSRLTVVAALALVPVGSVAFGASRRLLRPRLADVVSVHAATAAPRGDWLFVSGALAGMRYGWEPDFLFNPATGTERAARPGGSRTRSSRPTAAFAAWIEAKFLYDFVGTGVVAETEGTLVVRELDRGTEARTDVTVDDFVGVGWSPDGRRLAIVGERDAELRDAVTLHLVAQTRRARENDLDVRALHLADAAAPAGRRRPRRRRRRPFGPTRATPSRSDTST